MMLNKRTTDSKFPYLYISDTTVIQGASGETESGFHLYSDGTWKYKRNGNWIAIPAHGGYWRTSDLPSSAYQIRMKVNVGSDSTIQCSQYQPRDTYNWQSPTWGAWFNIPSDLSCYAHQAHTPPATWTEVVQIQVRTVSDSVIVSDSTILFTRD